MLNITGGILILTGGFLVRRLQMKERRRRREILSDLLCALRRLCEEIRCTKCPLPRLFERLGGACGEDAALLFKAAAMASFNGESMAEVWAQEAKVLPLSQESKDLLAGLGQDLHGDEDQICNAVSLVMLQLSREAEEMDNNLRADGQRISALCLSAAALLVILLI